jgi:hypothetical protein
MLAGSFADLRRRGVANVRVMVIHTIGWKRNAQF